MTSSAGMTKTTGIPAGSVQCFRLHKPGPIYPMNDDLRDPVTAMDDNRFFTVIDKRNQNFPPIIRIDGTGTVDQGDAITNRQSASGAASGA